MSNNSIVNFGDLSKPANTLIEKIAEGTGGLFKPWQIKRVAKAEAEALLTFTKAESEALQIRTQGEIDADELKRRAMMRSINEEAHKQQNMESIVSKALPEVKENAKPEEMDNDWIANFFDKCRLTSDDDMQLLWAKILAGEANRPGNYSKRTINFLQSIDKKEAELFGEVCNLSVDALGGLIPIIFHNDSFVIEQDRLNFDKLTHLDVIGLIKFDYSSPYFIEQTPEEIAMKAGNSKLIIKLEKDGNVVIGNVMLTRIGTEIASIVERKPIPGFEDYVIRKLKSKNVTVVKIIDRHRIMKM